ncbi:zinc finger protein Xfin-like isoform X4 [Cloeon dipterum]|uniref:zinc finger protein Xfin-like isoform X4 n=1 Tax=Cloeon dipterum TaxID=197152 RepID=UPI00321F7151
MAASTKVSDMCRLCGTDTLNVVRHHIFEGEGQVKKSAQKISECLPLHIAAEDPLPKNICGECSYKLDLMSDFREKAVKTDVMLVSLVEGVKPEIPDDDDDGPDHEIDNDFRSDTPVEQPEQQTEPEVLIKEEEAQQPQQPEKRPGRKAANKRPIQESDMEEEEEEAPAKKRGRKPKEKETAPAASATTSASTNPPKENTGGALKEKQLVCYVNPEDLLMNLRSVKEEGTDGQLTCHICLKQLTSKTALNLHMTLVHSFSDKVKCKKCDETFYSDEKLLLHEQIAHEGYIFYECLTCSKTLISHQLSKHLAEHGQLCVAAVKFDPEKPYDPNLCCQVCHLEFARQTHLKEHLRSAHSLKTLKNCQFCPKVFTSLSAAVDHTVIHQAEKQIDKEIQKNAALNPQNSNRDPLLNCCKICDETFANPHDLNRHSLIQHKVALMPSCAYCKKSYDSEQALMIHEVRLHQRRSLKQYHCEYCGVILFNKALLKNHQILQCKAACINPPNLNCIVCNKRFLDRFSLLEHQRETHCVNFKTVVGFETCQICRAKVWGARRGMKKHLDKYHNIVCNECCKTFATVKSLQLHMKTHNQTFCRILQKARTPVDDEPPEQPNVAATSLRGVSQGKKTETPTSRSFACTLCKKTFDSERFLTLHSLMHQSVVFDKVNKKAK